jgi:hypothetical protein
LHHRQRPQPQSSTRERSVAPERFVCAAHGR